MFALYRVAAVYRRHAIQLVKDIGRLLSAFYWPFLDIVLWGFTATWMQSSAEQAGLLVLLTIASAVYWQVAVRANLDVSISLLEEMWARNVTNLFASPLALSEWICAAFLLGLTMAGVMSAFCMAVAWVVYGVNLFAYWWIALCMTLLLYVGGIWIGFLAAGLLIRFGGERMQTLVFVLGWFFTPLAGVYYDIAVMPVWVQRVAQALPMMYAFGGMRHALATGLFPTQQWLTSLYLCLLYGAAAVLFFIAMFYLSKQRGLSRLDQ